MTNVSKRIDYMRNRRRMIAYDRWNPWTDAAPVRSAVAERVDAGVPYLWFAAHAGVHPWTVYQLLFADPPQKGIRPATAEKLAAAATEPIVTPVGAVRRIRALVAQGWNMQAILRSMESRSDRIKDAAAGKYVPGIALCQKIDAVFRQLWDKPPPERTREERTSATRARNHAERHGWVPALAWEPDKIDDASAVPVPGWRRKNIRSSAGVAEDFAELAARHPDRVADPGKVRADAARRLGITRDTLGTALARAARAERQQAARAAEQERAARAADQEQGVAA